MIIFGTRSMNSRVGSGVFYCPRCSVQRQYSHMAVKQWFTLYFIPVIPLGSRGEFVECTSCAGTYAAEVLQYDPEAERREALAGLRRLGALVLGEAGKLEPENIAALCQAIHSIGGDCTEAQVRDDWRLASQANAQVENYARTRMHDLTDKGRILALQLCIHSLRGASEMEPRSLETVCRLARGLNIGEQAVGQLFSDEHRLLT